MEIDLEFDVRDKTVFETGRIHDTIDYSAVVQRVKAVLSEERFGLVEKLADRVEALGGKRTRWNRNKKRVLRVTFPSLAESEMFGDVFRLNMLDEGEPIFVIPDPSDSTNFQKRSFLAELKEPPPIAAKHRMTGVGRPRWKRQECL